MPRKVVQGPTTDTPSEPFRTSSVLVVSLGSRNLRIGLASNYLPKTMPHAIARRRRQRQTQTQKEELRDDLSETQILALNGARHALQLMRMGLRRTNVSQDQIKRFNEKVIPQQTMEPSPSEWSDVNENPPFLTGQSALDISPDEPYDLFWPIQRGRLARASERLFCELETLWRSAIVQSTNIDPQNFKDYQVVIVVPDSFSRNNLKTVMTVMLSRLHFAAALIQQESACTAYGAGVPTACIVDVGDEKTSVCCIEDGIVNPASRFILNYGGRDITDVLYQLMKQASFPYAACDVSNPFDAALLNSLKEAHCYLEMELYGIKSYNFDVECPGKRVVAYQMQLLDEVCLAPLAVFYPDLFPRVNDEELPANQYDSEDLLDDPYLTEPTGSKAARVGGGGLSSMTPSPMPTEEGVSMAVKHAMHESTKVSFPKTLLPLDAAIQTSIDTFPGDDVKRRLYGCILLVGGGLTFPGAAQVVQSRLQARLPHHFQLNQVEVIAKPKDLDPMLVSWKGGAILSCLDSARDLWIGHAEWATCGIRILREKCPFIW
ncbi:actin-related protein 8-like [Oscarella lobularis]|uniref:actin-related protein 8-like n=1 Tax=Oscarella lobularis TaxID=121494 RepID=UPI003313DB04